MEGETPESNFQGKGPVFLWLTVNADSHSCSERGDQGTESAQLSRGLCQHQVPAPPPPRGPEIIVKGDGKTAWLFKRLTGGGGRVGRGGRG